METIMAKKEKVINIRVTDKVYQELRYVSACNEWCSIGSLIRSYIKQVHTDMKTKDEYFGNMDMTPEV
jgi:predicted CopG family antitoxin